MIPAFWITGLLFHQIFISELKNIPLTLWMTNYFWYALSAYRCIISGILVDKYTAHSIAVVTQLPMLFTLLWFGKKFCYPHLFLYFLALVQVCTNDQSLLAEDTGQNGLVRLRTWLCPECNSISGITDCYGPNDELVLA